MLCSNRRISRSTIAALTLLLIPLLLACGPKVVENDPSAHVPFETAPVWKNWSRDLKHKPSQDGETYYFSPTNREALEGIIARARDAGVELRVSGQRHSQPPLVVDDNHKNPPVRPKTFLVDLACYADLGEHGNEQIELDREKMQVTVNAGVREDYLDAYLTANDLSLKTVTAGGFFSLGGMTAVDVHGASVREGIFAETVSAFTIMGADGEVRTIRWEDRVEGEWSELQFARVSLGALGVVTSMTIDLIPRPHATTLASGRENLKLTTKGEFVAAFKTLLAHDRVESFFSPYGNRFVILWWDMQEFPDEKKSNQLEPVASSCTFAEKGKFGAPYEERTVEFLAEKTETRIQDRGFRFEAAATIGFSFFEIRKMFDTAAKKHQGLWLTEATRVAFMSYFIELPAIDDSGLGKVWDTLQVVGKIGRDRHADFRVATPLEFRFVRGGDTAMSGTYSDRDDSHFVNLDLIAFVPKGSAEDYPQDTLDFFGEVEREWYGTYGGLPHNGKMYGFHDPDSASGSTAPFNSSFMKHLAQRRGARLEAFERHRQAQDPTSLFCNEFLRAAWLCRDTEQD